MKRTSQVTIYELGHLYRHGLSTYHAVPAFQRLDANRHGDRVIGDGVSIASDVVITSTHCGTHIDALAHVADARQGTVSTDRPTAEGLPVLSARGILVDVADEVASRGACVGLSSFRRALADKGVEVQSGDVVLIRTGWEDELNLGTGRYGTDLDSLPGIDVDVARWLADMGVVAVGSDTPTLEPASTGFSVHRLLLQERGIYIIENLRLSEFAASDHREMLFLAVPLRIVGGTASPIRPLAFVGPPEALSSLMLGQVHPTTKEKSA